MQHQNLKIKKKRLSFKYTEMIYELLKCSWKGQLVLAEHKCRGAFLVSSTKQESEAAVFVCAYSQFTSSFTQ